jgi:hypothetical protein
MPPEDVSRDPLADPRNQHLSWTHSIRKQCELIRDGLLIHNEKYGSSIFRPVTILSSISAEDALRLRIDDRIRKLSCKNISRQQERELVDDLIGYLINFRAFMSHHEPEIWEVFE